MIPITTETSNLPRKEQRIDHIHVGYSQGYSENTFSTHDKVTFSRTTTNLYSYDDDLKSEGSFPTYYHSEKFFFRM